MTLKGSAISPNDWKLATKTVAFTGAAGNGAVGTVALFTTTGQVDIDPLPVYCSEDLVGAATLDWGVVGNADKINQILVIAAQFADATTFDAGDWWGNNGNTTATVAIERSGSARGVISANVILTIGANAVTDGTLVFYIWWRPLSAGATLVAA